MNQNIELSYNATNNIIDVLCDLIHEKLPNKTYFQILEDLSKDLSISKSAESYLIKFFEYDGLNFKQKNFYLKYKMILELDISLQIIRHTNPVYYDKHIGPYTKLTISEKLKLLEKNPILKTQFQELAIVTEKFEKLRLKKQIITRNDKSNIRGENLNLFPKINSKLNQIRNSITQIVKREFSNTQNSNLKKIITNLKSKNSTKKDFELLENLEITFNNSRLIENEYGDFSQIQTSKDAYISLLIRKIKTNQELTNDEFENILNILKNAILNKHPEKTKEEILAKLRQEIPNKKLLTRLLFKLKTTGALTKPKHNEFVIAHKQIIRNKLKQSVAK
jgi:hypothetical protein